MGSAAKPTTRVQEAAATPPPPEPGRDDGGDEELDKKTETETVKRVAGRHKQLLGAKRTKRRDKTKQSNRWQDTCRSEVEGGFS